MSNSVKQEILNVNSKEKNNYKMTEKNNPKPQNQSQKYKNLQTSEQKLNTNI